MNVVQLKLFDVMFSSSFVRLSLLLVVNSMATNEFCSRALSDVGWMCESAFDRVCWRQGAAWRTMVQGN